MLYWKLTLFAVQAVAGEVRRLVKTAWPLKELLPKLRESGIRHRSEVACVILEPTGEVTVLRRGILLDRSLMLDVRGVEHVPEEFFAAEP